MENKFRFYRLMQMKFRLAARRARNSELYDLWTRLVDCERHYTAEMKRLISEMKRDRS